MSICIPITFPFLLYLSKSCTQTHAHTHTHTHTRTSSCLTLTDVVYYPVPWPSPIITPTCTCNKYKHTHTQMSLSPTKIISHRTFTFTESVWLLARISTDATILAGAKPSRGQGFELLLHESAKTQNRTCPTDAAQTKIRKWGWNNKKHIFKQSTWHHFSLTTHPQTSSTGLIKKI